MTKQKYAPSNFNLEKGWGFEYSNQCKTLLIFAKFENSSKNPFHTTNLPFRVKKYQFMKISSIILDEIFLLNTKAKRKIGRNSLGMLINL